MLLTSSTNKTCYIDEKGARVTNQWVEWKGRRYYMASNGYALKGWQNIDGKNYYFYNGSGKRAQNVTLTSAKGIVSVFDINGVCIQQYKKQ